VYFKRFNTSKNGEILRFCWQNEIFNRNDTYKLNHCKEMGAKLGRRFLKQPAEKLKAVFVDLTDQFQLCFCFCIDITK